MKVLVVLAQGFEEIEGISIIDVLRRGEVPVDSVSINDEILVKGANNITVKADSLFKDVDVDLYDGIILPGGMPGTNNLSENSELRSAIKDFHKKNKLVAAICAAPSVLGRVGILKDKNATCYPGFEEYLTGAILHEESVVQDGNIITSRGPGTAILFGLKIVEYLKNSEVSTNLYNGMLVG